MYKSLGELWVFRKIQKICTASDQYFLSYVKKLKPPPPAGVGLKESHSIKSDQFFGKKKQEFLQHFCSKVVETINILKTRVTSNYVPSPFKLLVLLNTVKWIHCKSRAGQSSVNETEVFENQQKSPLTNGKTR